MGRLLDRTYIRNQARCRKPCLDRSFYQSRHGAHRDRQNQQISASHSFSKIAGSSTDPELFRLGDSGWISEPETQALRVF